jgi:intracellular septation protein
MTDPDARPKAINPWLKLSLEMGPLVLFFLANANYGIFAATGTFMAAILIAVAASWHLTRHVPTMMWVSAVIVTVFGGLTIYLNDERFIKIKPTLINGLFGCMLAFGLATGRSYLKVVLEASFPPMSERGWRLLTRNWMLFFFTMALVNEFVWRNFSTDFWVGFKAFGFVPLAFLFVLIQMPLVMRHQIADE